MSSTPATPTKVILSQPGLLQREQHLQDENWIPKPLRMIDDKSSSGLEILTAVDELKITRSVERGTICGSTLNYSIVGKQGKKAYEAIEESNCFCMFFCGPSRSYTVKLYNRWEREMVRLVRPYRCDGECTICCCCPCALMKINVINSIDNVVIGEVKQKLSFFKNEFEASSSDGKEKCAIRGRAIPCRCCTTASFQIFPANGSGIGEIWKRKCRTDPTMNTDHETFGITFPENTSVRMKGILLGAAFLLNHTYFEMS